MPGYGGKPFDPIEFDGAAPPAPDVTDGAYTLKCTAIEVSATNPEGKSDPTSYPMLKMTWEVTACQEPKGSPRYKLAAGSVGGEVLDRVVFKPEEKRGSGRPGKIRYQEICNLFGLNFNVVPLKLRDPSDFDPFIQAVVGQETPGWVKNEPDRLDPDRSWPRLFLTEPRNWGDNEEPAPGDDDVPAGDDIEPNDLEPGDLEEDTAAADGGDVEPAEDPEPEPEPEPEPPPPPARRTATKAAAPAAARAATNGVPLKAPAKPAATPAQRTAATVARTTAQKPPARR